MKILDYELDWDEFQWLGHITGPVFSSIPSSYVQLEVGTKDEKEMPPDMKQALELQQIMSAETAQKISNGFFAYYREMRPKYVRAGGEWAKNMPAVTTASEVCSMLQLNSIKLGWPYDGHLETGFSFGCDWDSEHGAGIVFKNGQQIDIGAADCLYCSH